MIKRTLYFGNPAYLNLSNAQLKIRLPVVERMQMFIKTELNVYYPNMGK
jgi:hypothetical protein